MNYTKEERMEIKNHSYKLFSPTMAFLFFFIIVYLL